MEVRGTRLYIAIFICIVALAAYLRLSHLQSNPPGFFTDEAAIGYNSFSLLTTGKDEYNISWPIFFKSYGDYRLPLPIYLNIPALLLLGPVDVAPRTTAAFAGVLTVVFLMVAVTIWLGRLPGIATGLSLTILPWHIHMSRWASEYVYFPFFFSLAFLFLIVFYKLKMRRYLYLSFALFGLTMYTYYPAIFQVPLYLLFILLGTSIIFGKIKTFRSVLVIAAALFFVSILPMIQGIVSGELLTRWHSVHDKEMRLDTQTAGRFLNNYFRHFDPTFLFLRGDEEMRHSVQHYGEAHLFQAGFILLGLLFLLFKRKSLVGLSIIWLFLLYPLGSSLTLDRLATRSIIGVVPISILSGLGIAWFIQSLAKISSRWMLPFGLGLLSIVIVLSMNTYMKKLFVDYPAYASGWGGFQYGYKEAMQMCRKYEAEFDDCFITHRFNQSVGLFSYYRLTVGCQTCKPQKNPIPINRDRNELFIVRNEDVQEAKQLYPDLTFYQLDSIVNPGGVEELAVGYFR